MKTKYQNVNNNFYRASKTYSNTISENSNFSNSSQVKDKKKKSRIKVKKINSEKKLKNIVNKNRKTPFNSAKKPDDKSISINNINFEKTSNTSLNKRTDDDKANKSNKKRINLNNIDNTHFQKVNLNKKGEIYNAPTIRSTDTLIIKNNNISIINIKKYDQSPFIFKNIKKTLPPFKNHNEDITDQTIINNDIEEGNRNEINGGNKININNYKDKYNQSLKLNNRDSNNFDINKKNAIINNNFLNSKAYLNNSSQNKSRILKIFEPEFIKQIKYRNHPIDQISNNNKKSFNVTILTKNNSFNGKIINKNNNKNSNKNIHESIKINKIKTDDQINKKSKTEKLTIYNNLIINHLNTNIFRSTTMYDSFGGNHYFYSSPFHENKKNKEKSKKSIKLIDNSKNCDNDSSNEDIKLTIRMDNNQINKNEFNKENSISTENNRDTIKNPKRSFYFVKQTSKNVEDINDSIQSPIEFEDNESYLLEQKNKNNKNIEFCKIQNKQNEDESVICYEPLDENVDLNNNKNNNNSIFKTIKKILYTEKYCSCYNTESLVDNSKSLNTCCNYSNCFGKNTDIETKKSNDIITENIKEKELNNQKNNNIINSINSSEIGNEDNEIIVNKNSVFNNMNGNNKIKDQFDVTGLTSKYRNHKIMILVSTIKKVQKNILRKFINKIRDAKSKITKFVNILSNIFENKYKLKKIGISKIKNYIEKMNKGILSSKNYSNNNKSFKNNNTIINVNNINNISKIYPKSDIVTLNKDYYNCKDLQNVFPAKNNSYYIKKNRYTSFKNSGSKTARRELSWTNIEKENSHQRNYNGTFLLNKRSNTDEHFFNDQINNFTNNFRYTDGSIRNIIGLNNNDNYNCFNFSGNKIDGGNVSLGNNIKQTKFIYKKNNKNNSNESTNRNFINEKEDKK